MKCGEDKKKVQIKAIDATLPNDDQIWCWERLSKKEEFPEGDYMNYHVN